MNQTDSLPHLLLFLDGPMQSWGYQSLFDRRNTWLYPTRSGLIGMFCAALGIDRSNTTALQSLAPLHLEVFAYQKLVSSRRGPYPLDYQRWYDYHTVGGGYDAQREKRMIPHTADGSIRGSIVTEREYLSDICYAVLVSVAPQQPEAVAENELLDRLHQALCDPRWGIWLGRKCCIPAFPICHGVHSNRGAAITHLMKIAENRPISLDQPLRWVVEVTDFEQGTDTLRDVPLDFFQRRFGARRVCEHTVPRSSGVSSENTTSDSDAK